MLNRKTRPNEMNRSGRKEERVLIFVLICSTSSGCVDFKGKLQRKESVACCAGQKTGLEREEGRMTAPFPHLFHLLYFFLTRLI